MLVNIFQNGRDSNVYLLFLFEFIKAGVNMNRREI